MATATEAPATTAEGLTQHTPNQTAQLHKLRAEFPASQVQALPKILCKACSESRTKVCENPQHQKSKCRVCDNYITSAHLHLDYVGHAELTHRLLDVDPLWDWEPLAFRPDGLPAFDENGGLWIRLTVCGHSRLGYGDAQGKRGPNAVKEAIGDALRNAAMRFGAALNLWAKSDLTEAQTEHPKSADEDYAPARAEQKAPASAPSPPQAESAPSEQPASDQDADELLNKLMLQAVQNRTRRDVLRQVRGNAEKKDVINREVQGPPPERRWMPFHELLDILDAEAAARAESRTERNAA